MACWCESAVGCTAGLPVHRSIWGMYIHGSASVLAAIGDIDVPWGISGYHF